MAATYHNVIGMIKLYDSSIWNFMGTFFKISLMDIGIILICFQTKIIRLQANVKSKLINNT